jgi:hypothetical protein
MANINNLTREITRYLQEYTNEVTEEIEVASQEVAKKMVKELKLTSPRKFGSYRKGWRAKKIANGRWIVHNQTDYRKTHLLEHGHAKKNGGRVAAQHHIAPAEDRAIAEFVDRVERAIRG